MPETRKAPKKPSRDPYRVRPCRLCKAKFKPTTHVISCADSQEFCMPAHRKEYWKYGGLPFDKLMTRLEKRMREIAREELEGLANLDFPTATPKRFRTAPSPAPAVAESTVVDSYSQPSENKAVCPVDRCRVFNPRSGYRCGLAEGHDGKHVLKPFVKLKRRKRITTAAARTELNPDVRSESPRSS